MSLTLHPVARLAAPLVNKLFLKQVRGLENIPRARPFIIAANHVSVPDEWLIGNLILQRGHPQLWFIGRDDFWSFRRWSRLAARFLGVLLIDWRRPAVALESALAILQNKGIVATFPEGVRNFETRALVLGKTGTVRLALKARCPIIPVGYSGPNIETVRDALKHFILARHTATIAFGQPIDLSDYYNEPITRELLYKLTDKVMVEIGKLCHKKPRLH